MNLLRKSKINKIIPVLSEREKECIAYIDSWFVDLRLLTINSAKPKTYIYFKPNNNFLIAFRDDGRGFMRDDIIVNLYTITTEKDAEEYLIHIFAEKTGLGRLESIEPIIQEHYVNYEERYREHKLKKQLANGKI
jgi:hypothetical protein